MDATVEIDTVNVIQMINCLMALFSGMNKRNFNFTRSLFGTPIVNRVCRSSTKIFMPD